MLDFEILEENETRLGQYQKRSSKAFRGIHKNRKSNEGAGVSLYWKTEDHGLHRFYDKSWNNWQRNG